MHIGCCSPATGPTGSAPACHGARLEPQALHGGSAPAPARERHSVTKAAHRPPDATLDAAAFAKLPGLCIHDVMRLPLDRCRRFFDELRLRAPLDDATELLLAEIRGRLAYLVEVGLGYLTLDRQSRTLSGGEVQRINLTTALGTSLVNTLFVLDEPSIGLHARDIARIVSVLHKLRDAGNTLLVVEHDPQIMLAADRVIDMGPGPGERGGEIVFRGTPRALLRSRRSVTAAWLRGERRIEPRAPAPARSSPVQTAQQNRSIRVRRPPPPTPSERIEIRGACASQSRRCRCGHPAAPLRLRDRCQRLGEVDPGRRCSLPRRLQATRAPHGSAGRTPGDPRGSKRSMTSSSSTSRPSARPPARTPASYVGALDAIRKRFARSRSRSSADTPRERSAQLRQRAAARAAAGTASSMSRCSS